MTDEELYECLLATKEVVEYGARWTPTTTHETWIDAEGNRRVRQVMSYHGGGSRGDDDEAEYVARLLNQGKAVHAEQINDDEDGKLDLPPEVTHVIRDGVAVRFRYYVAPPES